MGILVLMTGLGRDACGSIVRGARSDISRSIGWDTAGYNGWQHGMFGLATLGRNDTGHKTCCCARTILAIELFFAFLEMITQNQ